METPGAEVQAKLRELLSELRKVKDLNNMANEYKAVAAKLAVSLDTLLADATVDSAAFRSAVDELDRFVSESSTTTAAVAKKVNAIARKQNSESQSRANNHAAMRAVVESTFSKSSSIAYENYNKLAKDVRINRALLIIVLIVQILLTIIYIYY